MLPPVDESTTWRVRTDWLAPIVTCEPATSISHVGWLQSAFDHMDKLPHTPAPPVHAVRQLGGGDTDMVNVPRPGRRVAISRPATHGAVAGGAPSVAPE